MQKPLPIIGVGNGVTFDIEAEIFNFAVTTEGPCATVMYGTDYFKMEADTLWVRAVGQRHIIRGIAPIEGRPDIFIGVLRVDGVEVYRDERV